MSNFKTFVATYFDTGEKYSIQKNNQGSKNIVAHQHVNKVGSSTMLNTSNKENRATAYCTFKNSNENLNNNKLKQPIMVNKAAGQAANPVESMIQNNLMFTTNGAEETPIQPGKSLSSFNKCLKVNDRVNIDLSFEIVQSLQIGHGGWCEAMFEVNF